MRIAVSGTTVWHIREHESAIGLYTWPRVAKRRPLGTIADIR
ncbi:hypothetical protein [Arthrobacter monumenti]